jgi:hypothetical protein
MSDVGSNLAEQALSNLVNQFARPLDFLRELVQNSLDAGSPRVEVWVDFVSDVLEIHVDDYGEGMDERIIDSQLTRLFASTKENDLTKIGKFGIGFTSIFAVRPEAVLLRTGRHGEYWELVFHADRTYEKRRTDEPVTGTRITLFKRMHQPEVEPFVREARWILQYWCEHSDTPVTFWDRTSDEEAAPVDDNDPFAAFIGGAPQDLGPKPVNRPMELQADLSVHHETPTTRVVVGCAAAPEVGYYNGGLTLLKSTSPDALGPYSRRLSHLAIKLKSARLEHTLTRDNVLHDDHWRAAMSEVVQAADVLRDALIDRVEKVAGSGGELGLWHGYLLAECRTGIQAILAGTLRDRGVFSDCTHKPVTLAEIDAQERRLGCVVYGPESAELRRALVKEGVLMLMDRPETRALLDQLTPSSLFGGQTARSHQSAEALFVLPQLLDPAQWTGAERDLVRDTQRLLDSAAGSSLLKRAFGAGVSVSLGDFGGPEAGRRDALVISGAPEGEVFRRPTRSALAMTAALRARSLLVNRHHPYFQAQVLAAAESPGLAAYGLAQALLAEEGVEGEAAFAVLIAEAAGE